MTATGAQPDDPAVPAGFTYLGHFVDHDLTMDATTTCRASAWARRSGTSARR